MEKVPSVLQVLDGLAWHQEAACKDENDNTFFPDEALARNRPGSPTLVLPLLICATCPVRRECLEDALRPVVFSQRQSEPGDPATIVVRSEGVWGGTTEVDRDAVASLPVAEAVDVLEESLSERLGRHLEEYRATPKADRYRGPASLKSKRIDAILEDLRGELVDHLAGSGFADHVA